MRAFFELGIDRKRLSKVATVVADETNEHGATVLSIAGSVPPTPLDAKVFALSIIAGIVPSMLSFL
jgi:hypothetical protein